MALAAVVIAVAFGTYRLRTDGRFRAKTPVVEQGGAPAPTVLPVVEQGGAPAPTVVETPYAEKQPQPADLTGSRHRDSVPARPPVAELWTAVQSAIPTATLGERATLLQFSSAFCAPCRATRRVLADVATTVPGVEHLEVDAELHLELVRRVGVLRTPTTLVLDASGNEVARAAGAPRTEQVLAALPAGDPT